MGGFVVLMLVRMWSWGFELYLYDHDVFVSCSNGLCCIIVVCFFLLWATCVGDYGSVFLLVA